MDIGLCEAKELHSGGERTQLFRGARALGLGVTGLKGIWEPIGSQALGLSGASGRLRKGQLK